MKRDFKLCDNILVFFLCIVNKIIIKYMIYIIGILRLVVKISIFVFIVSILFVLSSFKGRFNIFNCCIKYYSE